MNTVAVLFSLNRFFPLNTIAPVETVAHRSQDPPLHPSQEPSQPLPRHLSLKPHHLSLEPRRYLVLQVMFLTQKVTF